MKWEDLNLWCLRFLPTQWSTLFRRKELQMKTRFPVLAQMENPLSSQLPSVTTEALWSWHHKSWEGFGGGRATEKERGSGLPAFSRSLGYLDTVLEKAASWKHQKAKNCGQSLFPEQRTSERGPSQNRKCFWMILACIQPNSNGKVALPSHSHTGQTERWSFPCPSAADAPALPRFPTRWCQWADRNDPSSLSWQNSLGAPDSLPGGCLWGLTETPSSLGFPQCGAVSKVQWEAKPAPWPSDNGTEWGSVKGANWYSIPYTQSLGGEPRIHPHRVAKRLNEVV